MSLWVITRRMATTRSARKLLARFARRGISVTPEEMVITTGCTQALHGMIRLLAQPGDVVACEAPAYYATLEMLGDTGIRVLPIPVRDSRGVDLDLVATLFERFRPKFFVICSTLSNPSGATMPNEARQALLEICRKTRNSHSGRRDLRRTFGDRRAPANSFV